MFSEEEKVQSIGCMACTSWLCGLLRDWCLASSLTSPSSLSFMKHFSLFLKLGDFPKPYRSQLLRLDSVEELGEA